MIQQRDKISARNGSLEFRILPLLPMFSGEFVDTKILVRLPPTSGSRLSQFTFRVAGL
jgi:hypothetical protein